MIKNVGFIGAGVMGKSMIRNLMKKGFQVTVYSRTKSKAEDIIAEGAIWRDSALSVLKVRTSSSPLSVFQRMWKKLILAKRVSLPIPKAMPFSLT